MSKKLQKEGEIQVDAEALLDKEEVKQEEKQEEKQEVKPKVNYFEEKIDFYVPVGRTEEEQSDIIIAVNGKTVQVQRGKTVQLPRKYVLAYERSVAQDAAARHMQNMLSNVNLTQ